MENGRRTVKIKSTVSKSVCAGFEGIGGARQGKICGTLWFEVLFKKF